MFKCDKCDCQVMSSCGHDYGMLAVTDTYICKSRKEIVDVYIREFVETLQSIL